MKQEKVGFVEIVFKILAFNFLNN